MFGTVLIQYSLVVAIIVSLFVGWPVGDIVWQRGWIDRRWLAMIAGVGGAATFAFIVSVALFLAGYPQALPAFALVLLIVNSIAVRADRTESPIFQTTPTQQPRTMDELLDRVYAEEITNTEAEYILSLTRAAAEEDESRPWWDGHDLTRDEVDVIESAGLRELARIRSEGWPKCCQRCEHLLTDDDWENNNWLYDLCWQTADGRGPDDSDEALVFRHNTCPSIPVISGLAAVLMSGQQFSTIAYRLDIFDPISSTQEPLYRYPSIVGDGADLDGPVLPEPNDPNAVHRMLTLRLEDGSTLPCVIEYTNYQTREFDIIPLGPIREHDDVVEVASTSGTCVGLPSLR